MIKNNVVGEIKVGIGVLAALVGGPVVSEIKLTSEDGNSYYLSLCEVDGCPTIYKTEKSTFYQQLDENSDDEFFEELEKCCLFSGEYEELLRNDSNELYKAYRYLVYLTRCATEEVEPFVSSTSGKNIMDIEIPIADVEESLI